MHVKVFGGEKDPVVFFDGDVLSVLVGVVGKSFLSYGGIVFCKLFNWCWFQDFVWRGMKIMFSKESITSGEDYVCLLEELLCFWVIDILSVQT